MGLILTIVFIGIIGYVWVEGWSVFDAFYMTVITVTTVGFNEVHVMSDWGKLFTAFLIITSFGTFAYAISAVTTYIVSGDYVKYYKEFKKMKSLQNLSGHTIVCGYGRVGNQAAHDLKFYKKKFLVIERSPEVSENDLNETMFIKGDATKDKILVDAGVKTATALITALPKDADNLFVVLSARELNPNLKIISRASSYSSMRKLRIAGANNVIMPDTVGGAHMASLVVNPDVMEFLDLIKISGKAAMNLEEIDFKELPENLQFCTINNLVAKAEKGCNVIGYKSAEGNYIINPDGEIKIGPGSKLFVLGNPNQIKSFNNLFGIKPSS
ncbi:potassium channel family protein [Putridiphycobacter roseus]|uniref:potassium channel family protein n=1 Tax=Putridiphycobacter roseus TaxID=2219161 RepID=UPI001F1C898E|nr:potassium channel protein [Putridiphycobacter roseus]